MNISRRSRHALAAAVLLVGLTACGSNGSDKADTTTTKADSSTTTESGDRNSTTTEATATTGSGDKADAEKRAEAANLTIEDLPDGWTAIPAGDSDGNNVFDTCGDLDLDEITVAKVSSDNFEHATTDGGVLNLRTTSGVLASEKDAQAMVDVIGDDAFADCTTTNFTDISEVPGMTGSVAPTPTEELPDVADQVAALSGMFTIPTPQGDSTMNVIIIGVRTGDLVTTIMGMAIDTEPDGAILQDVVNVVADRQAG
ncbi:MAG: hypothetical protein H6519_03205 [Microthrixaceae bacterium]|nr:hypothetical protein [Acidimicrobiales bacterium]MCB9403422.1 hypothetical protein [Microthrixaceae bacterium]